MADSVTQPAVRLGRLGCSWWRREGDLERWRNQLGNRHALRIPGLIDPALLQFIQEQIERDGFAEHVHDALPSRPTDLRVRPGTASALLLLLTNDPRFLEFARAVSDRPDIRGFSGAVSRRVPGAGHDGAWHDDAVEGRRAALTINLSAAPFEGGILQIQDARSREIVCECTTTGPGDAVLFELDRGLKHRVTTPVGGVARTAFAGWFVTTPARRLLGSDAAPRA